MFSRLSVPGPFAAAASDGRRRQNIHNNYFLALDKRLSIVRHLLNPCCMKPLFRVTILSSWASLLTAAGEDGKLAIYSGTYENGVFQSLTFVNPVMGWDAFFNSGFRGASTVIGNIEAGNIWFGHEAFVRAPGATTGFSTYVNPAAGSLNELDYHATTVGHVLAGSGYIPGDNGGSFSNFGLGMAPEASLVSAGVAVDFSATDLGSFSTTDDSVILPYRAFFQGTGLAPGLARPDVINSSWGGGDSSATWVKSLAIDALARQNPSVAHVASAGNGGTATVVSPAAGFNSIAVGSLGGASFLQPSSFSSSGLADFYNPAESGGTNHAGVRVAVDLAAPGEQLALAAYKGDSGSIGASSTLGFLIANPVPTNQYFLNMDGTSYAAPFVAGGIALLKDVANSVWTAESKPEAYDTRVIKSVLMAGAEKTLGWNNGQNAFNVTTQALDVKTGAGAMNLLTAADVYFSGNQDIAEGAARQMSGAGWDSATIPLGGAFDYVFETAFAQETALNVALNWFSVREFDNLTNTGSDIAFSNLNLEVWMLDGNGAFASKIGESMTTYNNTEFLRFDAVEAGRYGFRVTYDSKIFDLSNAVTQESYALAWNTVAIPEPSALFLLLGSGVLMWKRRRV